WSGARRPSAGWCSRRTTPPASRRTGSGSGCRLPRPRSPRAPGA
ncbi:MAG: hypothetical protein AVDCRST_MAG48-1189, partial [uncultured Friedmanniella sp.]